ncbi:MAG: hypothetical protein J5507_04580 [Clostridia bacterium]|nr:hypothetical protein [Clostridia bacterium]
MKNKILIFVIGFLVEAIIATGGYIIYEKTKKTAIENLQNQFPGGNLPQMIQDGNMQTPPEKPAGDMKKMPEANNQIQNENTEKKNKKQINEAINEKVETNI